MPDWGSEQRVNPVEVFLISSLPLLSPVSGHLVYSCLVSESSFVSTAPIGKGMIARVLVPKITEREAEIVSREVAAAAMGANWRVALDMSQVSFLASAGIGTLVNLHQQSKKAGGQFVVFGLNDQLMQVLKISRLDKLFPIKPDADAAGKLVS